MTAPVRTALILGGTTEGYALADALTDHPGWRAVSSLAGRTRQPRLPTGEHRIGGFGGPDGLTVYLRDCGIAAVIDATHPFARRMGWNAAAACAAAGVPLLRLDRPVWSPGPSDRWQEVDDWDQAVQALREQGIRRAFLALGRQEAEAFVPLTSCHFVIRAVDLPDPRPAFADAEWILARGPFPAAAEEALFRQRQIQAVVCKNSGGPMDGKLTAARALSLPVILLRRPPRPPTATAATVDAALAWLDRL